MPVDEKVIISSDILSDTADAIRERGGTNSSIKPINFASDIENLPNAFTITFERATPNATVTATRTGASFSATSDANGDGTLIVFGPGEYTVVDVTTSISRNITFTENNMIAFKAIPDNYQQVEYLQNVGGGYIDTEISSDDYHDIGIDITFSLDTVSTNGAIFGGRLTQLTNTYTLFFLNSPKFRFDADGQREIANSSNMLFNTTSIYRFLHNAVDKREIITNLTSGDSAAISNINVSTYSTYPVSLFAVNTNGSVGTFGLIKIYSCSFYDGNTEICRFIPCYRKADSMPGMYDYIGGNFYPTQGNYQQMNCGPDVN